jgi:hypothetical protein
MHFFAHSQHILYLSRWRQIYIVYSFNYEYDASVWDVDEHGRHNRFVDLDKVFGFCSSGGLSLLLNDESTTYLFEVTSKRHVDVCNYKATSNSLCPVSKYFISSFKYVLANV